MLMINTHVRRYWLYKWIFIKFIKVVWKGSRTLILSRPILLYFRSGNSTSRSLGDLFILFFIFIFLCEKRLL